ncbi:MAG: hypothetical protein ACW99G_03640 [Candidatus Thorarchaeota archaeon]|jgi:hypothetical protein
MKDPEKLREQAWALLDEAKEIEKKTGQQIYDELKESKVFKGSCIKLLRLYHSDSIILELYLKEDEQYEKLVKYEKDPNSCEQWIDLKLPCGDNFINLYKDEGHTMTIRVSNEESKLDGTVITKDVGDWEVLRIFLSDFECKVNLSKIQHDIRQVSDRLENSWDRMTTAKKGLKDFWVVDLFNFINIHHMKRKPNEYKKMIENKEIRVNGVPAEQDQLLSIKDTVNVHEIEYNLKEMSNIEIFKLERKLTLEADNT